MARKPTSPAAGLPPRIEAYVMKNGKTSYRYKPRGCKAIPLGWNREEALETHKRLTLAFTEATIDSDATELWMRHRKGAKARGVTFDLSLNQVETLLRESNGRCAITGVKFSNLKPNGKRIRPWRASIDRKDPSKGYTTDNCRLVCAFVNVGMNQFGDSFYTELIDAIVRRVVREELLSNSNFGILRRRNSHRGSKTNKTTQ